MPGNPFKGAAKPRAPRPSPKRPATPRVKTPPMKTANIGSKGQGPGTSPAFRNTKVTTKGRDNVSMPSVPKVKPPQ